LTRHWPAPNSGAQCSAPPPAHPLSLSSSGSSCGWVETTAERGSESEEIRFGAVDGCLSWGVGRGRSASSKSTKSELCRELGELQQTDSGDSLTAESSGFPELRGVQRTLGDGSGSWHRFTQLLVHYVLCIWSVQQTGRSSDPTWTLDQRLCILFQLNRIMNLKHDRIWGVTLTRLFNKQVGFTTHKLSPKVNKPTQLVVVKVT